MPLSCSKLINRGFAVTLKRGRLLSKLSQEDLANKLDVSGATVSDWESGNSLPRKKNLEKIVRFLAHNSEGKEELRCAWRQEQMERHVEPAGKKVFKALMGALDEAICASQRDPDDRAYQRVKRAAWDNVVRRVRQVKQHYSDD